MTLMELKDFITRGLVPTEFLIIVNKDNPFLAKQYIDVIDRLAEGGIRKIKSIYEPQQSSLALLTETEGLVNVVNVETFDERSEDYSQFENTIVVCEQVDKSIIKNVEQFIIKMPKLEEWQIFDFAKNKCKNIDDEELLWLIKASNNDIERVLNELDKVALFEKDDQKIIFSSIRLDPQTDLVSFDLFTIVNALVEGNKPVLYDFLKHNGYESIEPVVIANRALTSLKNIVLASQSTGLDAADCGMSPKQFSTLKTRYRSLNIDLVRQKIKFLANFDLALKTSQLDLSKRDMLSYLVNNLTYKITL
jgi:hypothetical protein